MRTGARGITGAALLLVLAASLSAQKSGPNTSPNTSKDAKAPEPQRPKLSLRAQPAIAIAPARVVLTAEFTGGSDDFEEYYCPTVRWEWGDLSSSESALDCAPYEEGKTQIKRRFTIEHKFEHAGSFKVFFRLKHGSKEVAAISTMIKLQPGGAPDSDP
jgi:hypothetical protein